MAERFGFAAKSMENFESAVTKIRRNCATVYGQKLLKGGFLKTFIHLQKFQFFCVP